MEAQNIRLCFFSRSLAESLSCWFQSGFLLILFKICSGIFHFILSLPVKMLLNPVFLLFFLYLLLVLTIPALIKIRQHRIHKSGFLHFCESEPDFIVCPVIVSFLLRFHPRLSSFEPKPSWAKYFFSPPNFTWSISFSLPLSIVFF